MLGEATGLRKVYPLTWVGGDRQEGRVDWEEEGEGRGCRANNTE